MKEFKSGFCTIIGPPNAGKSTLINTILNYSLNIVSPKPQTTRNSVLGVYNEPHCQIIFNDTPGLLKKKNSLLDKEMNKTILRSIDQTDIILYILDITTNFKPYLESIAETVKSHKVIMVFNKIDQNPDFTFINEYELPYPYVCISAQENQNITQLLETIKPLLTDHIEYYPQDMLSNRTERFFVKEYIREALLNNLHQEIPHSLFVDIDEMDESSPNITKIKGSIYSDRESHKKIIVGNKGQMIKQIGMESRQKMQDLLQKNVYLELVVKVSKDWKNNPHFLKKLEYY